jgi:hypothetical protein
MTHCQWFPKHCRIVVPSSSEVKILGLLDPGRWLHYSPLECFRPLTQQHSVTSQKTQVLWNTSIRTSKLVKVMNFSGLHNFSTCTHHIGEFQICLRMYLDCFHTASHIPRSTVVFILTVMFPEVKYNCFHIASHIPRSEVPLLSYCQSYSQKWSTVVSILSVVFPEVKYHYFDSASYISRSDVPLFSCCRL